MEKLENKIRQAVKEMISHPGTSCNEDYNIKTFTNYICDLVKAYTDGVIGETYTNKRSPYFRVSDLNAKNDLIIAQRAISKENL